MSLRCCSASTLRANDLFHETAWWMTTVWSAVDAKSWTAGAGQVIVPAKVCAIARHKANRAQWALFAYPINRS